MVIELIRNKIKYNNRIKEWKKKNSNNNTWPLNEFDFDRVTIGNGTYGGIQALISGENGLLKIGNFCSIGGGVVFALSADHPLNYISTYPFRSNIIKKEGWTDALSKGDIVIDDDVWLGQNSIILSGVHIGQGAVIAAGAVIDKDMPPYAIVGGVPGKVIKYRFEPEMIGELLKVDFSKLDKASICEHDEQLYQVLTDPKQLEWLPKKHY